MKLRSVLAAPAVFTVFNWLVGAPHSRLRLVCDYIKPQAGDRLVDIGCGMAEISALMPDVDYCGFDISKEYIHQARQLCGDRVTLLNKEFTDEGAKTYGPFDIAIAVGVQHHLSDVQLLSLLQTVKKSLKPGGRFITIDGCYASGQLPITKYILSKDRGEYVRDQAGYEKIVSQVFEHYRTEMRHDMLRIPYTHLIIESQKQAEA